MARNPRNYFCCFRIFLLKYAHLEGPYLVFLVLVLVGHDRPQDHIDIVPDFLIFA